MLRQKSSLPHHVAAFLKTESDHPHPLGQIMHQHSEQYRLYRQRERVCESFSVVETPQLNNVGLFLAQGVLQTGYTLST